VRFVIVARRNVSDADIETAQGNKRATLRSTRFARPASFKRER
jgi:hypothetical protein